jgi:ribonuclease T2
VEPRETHGTCISTLETDCYPEYQIGDEVVDFFSRVVELFKGLDTYTVRFASLLSVLLCADMISQILANAGITPSSSQSYALSDMSTALENAFGAPVILQCDKTDAVYEIYYGFNVQGSVQKGAFVPTEQTRGTTN